MADLLDICRAAQTRLKSDKYFESIDVLYDRDGNVVELAAEALAKSGLYVMVYLPDATVESPSAPGPELHIAMNVDVWEYVPINRTAGRPHALTVAQHVIALLHHYTPPDLPSCFAADRRALTRIELDDYPFSLIYQCRFVTQEAIQYIHIPI